ncbi:MAG: hypothetical protein QOE92_182 [Chloroflexota bacterium]|jgi:hypothetical protein|nr:hypothetical protein [Chloroflexota bacterium]
MWLILYFLATLAFAFYSWASTRDTIELVRVIPYACFPPLVALFLLLYARMSYVTVEEEGLRVRGPIRRATVPFADIEKARMDTLDRAFEKPELAALKRSNTVKNMGAAKVLCVRVRDDDGLPERLRKSLGSRRLIPERELILPITEADRAMAALKQRLGSRRVQDIVAPSGRRHNRRKKSRR